MKIYVLKTLINGEDGRIIGTCMSYEEALKARHIMRKKYKDVPMLARYCADVVLPRIEFIIEVKEDKALDKMDIDWSKMETFEEMVCGKRNRI